jgi:hypothetical protein
VLLHLGPSAITIFYERLNNCNVTNISCALCLCIRYDAHREDDNVENRRYVEIDRFGSVEKVSDNAEKGSDKQQQPEEIAELMQK